MLKKRIYYHDTDCGGVVYYANYLKYTEEARTDFFEARGIFIKSLVEEGILFVVAHQEIDYKFPAFYGDILSVNTEIIQMRVARIDFSHEIKNQDGRLICMVKLSLVCVDNKIKPQAVPDKVRLKLQ